MSCWWSMDVQSLYASILTHTCVLLQSFACYIQHVAEILARPCHHSSCHSSLRVGAMLADHALFLFTVRINRPASDDQKVTRRAWRHLSPNTVASDLAASTLSSDPKECPLSTWFSCTSTCCWTSTVHAWWDKQQHCGLTPSVVPLDVIIRAEETLQVNVLQWRCGWRRYRRLDSCTRRNRQLLASRRHQEHGQYEEVVVRFTLWCTWRSLDWWCGWTYSWGLHCSLQGKSGICAHVHLPHPHYCTMSMSQAGRLWH